MSTPVAATWAMFCSVMLPLASSLARPAVSSTAFFMVGRSMLSSIITSTPQSRASCNSSRVRVSHSIFTMWPVRLRKVSTALVRLP